MIFMSIMAAIPLVTGRHRNRALATARRVRAVELATEGHTYQQIADELGYANRGTVYRIVHQALARDRVEAVENLQQLESARLDALQVAVWDKAMNGDAAAAQAVVRIITARSRLLGLDGVAETGHGRPRTLVVPGG